ncbi:hypothetical protein CVT29_016135 [Acinetobacter baumannii]|nr:hypothetical protein CVT29_016135 [Acinetobacter baumannii]
MLDAPVQPDKPEHKNRPNDIFHHHLIRGRNNIIKAKSDMQALVNFTVGEFKHEVRQFEKSYDNQQAEQISLMV